MATPFQNVYSRFLGKVRDYSFPKMTQEEFEETANIFMVSALVKFKQCKQNLANRDDTLAQFNITLTDEEIEIIGKLMVLEWLDPEITDTLNLKQVLTDRDFKIYSQSQHIIALSYLKKDLKKEIQALISSYSYNSLEDSL